MIVNMESPFSLWVQLTKQNNVNPLHNYDVPDVRFREMSTKEIMRLLDEAFANEVMAIYFEGGEPLLRPDLVEIVAHTTPSAYTLLRTNGTLVTPKLASSLHDLGMGVVCVDLEGASQEVHDRAVRRVGSFAETVRGIRELVSCGLRVFVLTILTRHTAEELSAIADLSANLGAEKLGILRLYPLGRARLHWAELALSLEEQMSALDRLLCPPELKLMQSWHPKDPSCCWQMGAVDAYGYSIGCPYLRDFANYGNVRDKAFMDTWRDPRYIAVRSANPAQHCVDCGAQDPNRQGGCRSTAYAFTGSWDSPDPFCVEMNEGINLTTLPAWIQSQGFGAPELMDLESC